jgi:hypothetical protein
VPRTSLISAMSIHRTIPAVSRPIRHDQSPTGGVNVWVQRLALVLLGIIAYANSFAGVLLLDDFGHIVTSESIR